MNILFLIAMILEGLAAVIFIAVPGAFFGLLGVRLDEAGVLLARLCASALLPLLLVLWRARTSTDAALRQLAVRGLFAFSLVSAASLAVAQVGGLMNALGWAFVSTHAGITIWSGTFLKN